MNLRSPIPPIPPPSFGQRLRRSLAFYSVIALIILVWAASSLVIAPVVQFGIDRFSAWIEKTGSLHQEAILLDLPLSIPCDSFENVPTGCDGLPTEGPARYGAGSVLYFWGAMPELIGLSTRQRALGEVPDAGTDGVFYSLQKSFGRFPEGDEVLAFARGEMAHYGSYTERQAAPGVIVLEAGEGSAAKAGNFYAVYTRDDGLKVPASCFGETCRVLLAPWRDGFAYGVTINKRNAQRLPEFDAAVRKRLDGFVVVKE